ncbi:hypothetical protein QSH18_01710 [Xanthomonas sp. NCPPB 2654]|uniref:hypothetical protein n=1 Tax=unclassified Xanthomonas TaxID=2643310 RepID=UPI0021E07A86|nr:MULTISPECIES: hypothetical protein [unclassified Xanthomonas]MDL5364314.1 hypothetical protein [Xanthomonas sp. NCPPB 2654]UYC20391.1 hypothetical protein NUG20_19945 [Xanthomonas sp. CFBP 8443]
MDDVHRAEKRGCLMWKKFGGSFGKMGLGKMSKDEYQANLNGMNMFFGAVLGLVLAGTEKLNDWQFGVVLTMLAGIVISILFISSSRHRVVYAIYTVVLVLTLPRMADLMLRGHDVIPGKVQPTLIVWTAMTIMVEFWGRERDQAASTVGSDQSG